MVDHELVLYHLEHAVLQWLPAVLILHDYQVVFGAFDVKDMVLEDASFPVFFRCFESQINNFLLCDHDSILGLQAAQVDVLIQVVFIVDLFEDMPGYP